MIRPIALPNPTAYHMFPSGPAVIPNGYGPVGERLAERPVGETSPTWPRSFRVNQRSPPAGLVAIPAMPESPGTGYSVISPDIVIFPMWRGRRRAR